MASGLAYNLPEVFMVAGVQQLDYMVPTFISGIVHSQDGACDRVCLCKWDTMSEDSGVYLLAHLYPAVLVWFSNIVSVVPGNLRGLPAKGVVVVLHG